MMIQDNNKAPYGGESSRGNNGKRAGYGLENLLAVALVVVMVLAATMKWNAGSGQSSEGDQSLFHRHSWVAADCTNPQICTDCGETQGEALGHDWKEATVSAPQTCARCGETQGVTSADEILIQAAEYARTGNYRLAIQLLDTAWEEYGLENFREAASDYRTQFGNYHGSRVAAGKYNSILIHSDGSVDIFGDNTHDERKADSWMNIVFVGAGDKYTVGLRADGTVIGAGSKDYKQYTYAEKWEKVIAISAGDFHTVGLLEGGIVVSSTSFNHCGEANVEQLMVDANGRKIVAVSAGYDHTLALLEDGTVVACGDRDTADNKANGVCDVSDWRDIAAICSGTEFCAGLKTDGTVVVAGVDWDLSGWTDINGLAAGDYFLVGLKSDGTVLYKVNEQIVGEKYSSNQVQKMYYVTAWTDIVYIAAGHDHIVGIRADGSVVCAGSDSYGQCGLDGRVVDLSD